MNYELTNIPNLDIKISHRNWEKALAKSFAFLSIAEPGDVLNITGPSRGGKSKLVEELKTLLTCNELESPDYMPVVIIEAANSSTNGKFSTKEFTYRLLDILCHPTLSTSGDFNDDIFTLKKLESISEWTMRTEVEKCLKRRRTRFLFIDEAQHVKYASAKSQAPEAVMDSWKCLAKEANVVLIIVGAYPVVNVIQKSSHLIGRKTTVELRRYTLCADDIREFAIILDSFSSVLNLSSDLSSLRSIAEILYHGSYGCIGLLKKWLKEAVAEAMVENQGNITKGIIMSTAPSDSDRKEIIREIIVGEEALKKLDLQALDNSKIRPKDKNLPSETSVKKKRKTKPFTQTPKRLKQGNRMEYTNEI